MKKFFSALLLASVLMTAIPTAGLAAVKANADAMKKKMLLEGPVLSADLVVGPFDLHRKYRSMEGPYVMQKLRVGDLLASRHVIMPESMVLYLEGNQVAKAAMSMQGVLNTSVERDPNSQQPLGLVDSRTRPRELFWLKGMELEVLDENDKPLPTAEFICHMNLDVDPTFRELVFPRSEGLNSGRLMTLTQGQTAFFFPRGFAVPAASDEVWTYTLQAANRTTNEHRRVKHRLKLYFMEDSQLKEPIKALYWFNPYLAVALDKQYEKPSHANGHIDCFGITEGKAAPNTLPSANFKDSRGRWVSGHWEVPPGTTMWRSPVLKGDRESLTEDRLVHAVWSHVHPLCETSSMIVCDGTSRKALFTAKVKTNTKNGLELAEIEDIVSSKGIVLPGKKDYEIEAKYVNTTGESQDSMVALGVFCADSRFQRPIWPQTPIVNSVLSAASASVCLATGSAAPSLASSKEGGKEGVYCGMRPATTTDTRAGTTTDTASGIKIASASGSTSATASATHAIEQPASTRATAFLPFPLFDPQKDGPLMKRARQIELQTSAGVINLILDPALAPQHATQMHKLLTRGAMNGTALFRYEPNFVLQFNTADRKAVGQQSLSLECQDLIRKLPIEIPSQPMGVHRKWSLSMARYDEKDSAVSSFSILLQDSPHLDGEYTVFGRVAADDVSRQTIAKIVANWPGDQPFIMSATDRGEYVAASADSNTDSNARAGSGTESGTSARTSSKQEANAASQRSKI